MRADSAQDSWLEKLGGEQLTLACEEESEEPVVHVPTVGERAAARRIGQEWTEPFKPTDGHLSLPLPGPAASPTAGDDITPR